MNKLNVLQVTHDMGLGGAEKVVADISTHLSPAKFNCYILCLFDGGINREIVEKKRVTVKVLKLRQRSILNFPLFLYDVINIIVRLSNSVKENKIDVIQSHLERANYYSIFVGLLFRIPVLVTIHSTAEFEHERSKIDFRFRLKKFFNFCVYRFCTKLIAVSSEVKDTIKEHLKLNESKVVTINNAVDIEVFARQSDLAAIRHGINLKDNELVVSSIGRLEAIKGHILLLQSIPDIIRRQPNIKFLMIGSGSEEQRLRNFARDHCLNESVKFLGERSDIAELLSLTDIFVMPSLAEGMSIAMLEAMASGTAIVATNTRGIRDLIKHQETGILFPKGKIDQLSEEILRLIRDPNLRKRLGSNAQQYISKHYSMQRFVSNVEKLYTSCVKSN